jgi:membrane protease YdiL (CAAX protease family)
LFLGVVWRGITFYAICVAALFLIQTLIQVVGGMRRVDPQNAVFQLTTFLSALVATWIMLRKIDKLPWSEVGLDRPAAAPGLVVKGALFGGLTIGLASVALLSVRMLRIDPGVPGSWWAEAGRSTVVLLPAAFFEELFIRGYFFAILRRAAGWKVALVVTSIIFGFLHVANPGADSESILAVIVAGFFLGAILLVTRSLYAAGAAHFAWNWVMSGALHIAVSGMPSADPDYKVVDAGPDWLTGGPWGPEGGIAAVAAMFIVLFYLFARYQRQMEWKA